MTASPSLRDAALSSNLTALHYCFITPLQPGWQAPFACCTAASGEVSPKCCIRLAKSIEWLAASILFNAAVAVVAACYSAPFFI
ncbi:hypothetical protein QF022_002263 [Vogesella perlucida]|jgi:hypothetical protein|nr:hypothetical protein [Vogesella perlucida]